MNRQTTIARKQTGTRKNLNTDWPVETVVVRVALPGRRVQWDVLYGLCNGVADCAESYATKRDAMRALESWPESYEG